MTETFYITTPIYYVNDKPHIGHAYTTIACDVMARYKRMKGYDVMFLTGTDEHGQKIQTAAQSHGKTPQEFVDEIHQNFKALWRKLNISNDDFIRTTEARHVQTVQKVFTQLMEQGDIYKGKYSGYYCVPDETYVPENAMGPGKTCPDCGRPLVLMEEESYFFRASKYVPELIAYYEQNLKAIIPSSRYNEIMSFLNSGVRDQSVSRTSLKWGIPVPGDPEHVIYVWFDALINYMSAVGYLDDPEKFMHYWTKARHMVGKDIIRFHCVTWPLMLLALGVSLPVEVIAHGWWTIDARKMSKSLHNVVSPLDMVDKYGLDAFRYFLMREVPFGLDGDFSESALAGRINSDLANDLGNLLNRTVQMITSYREGVVPVAEVADELSDMTPKVLNTVDEAMSHYAYDEALKTIWQYIGRANKYIDETMPWKLSKSAPLQGALDTVLLSLYEALRFTGLMIAPFMPDTAHKIYTQLGIDAAPVMMKLNEFKFGAGAMNQVHKGEILFPRIDLELLHKPIEPSIPHEPEIGIEDFSRVEMRVAEVLKCDVIPKSRKLYKLQVDLGYETRTVCSGIKAFFSPDDLVGKRVILVTNLKPVKLCGIESNGMILCASVKKEGVSEQLTILTPEKDIPLGSRVS